MLVMEGLVMRPFIRLFCLVGVGLLLIAGGCASRVVVVHYDPAAVAGETFTVNPPQAVLGSTAGPHGEGATRPNADAPARADTDALAEAGGGATPARQPEPWYLARNNERLGYRPNARSVSVSDYVIYIDDTQRSFGEHIHNHFRRSYRAAEYGTAVD